MKAENFFRPVVFVLSIVSMMSGTSCGQFLGDLKHDMDDTDPRSETALNIPSEEDASTTGGSWAERGYLENEQSNNGEKVRGLATDRSGDSSSPSVGDRKIYKYGTRATRDDFVDQSQEEGSLWASGGQTNYYFTKNKIRSPGDILTMVIESDLYRDLGIEVKQTLSPHEKAMAVKGVKDQFRTKYLDALDKSGKGGSEKDTLTTTAAAAVPAAGTAPAAPSEARPEASPTPPKELMSSQDFDKKMAKIGLDDVDIYSLLSVKQGETMLGEIIGRYPNGNYKIRMVKRIPFNGGPPRMVSVVGVVKATDINEDTDTVSSGKLYEYRIEVAH